MDASNSLIAPGDHAHPFRWCASTRGGCASLGGAMALASRCVAVDRSAVHRAGDAVLRRSSRHRHPGTGRQRLRASVRRRALRGVRGRSTGAVDPTPWRASVELRTGVDLARRRGPDRWRSADRNGSTWALLRAVPALWGATGRRVCVSTELPGRNTAIGAAADSLAITVWPELCGRNCAADHPALRPRMRQTVTLLEPFG